jgi:hypothetical protein
MSRALGPFLLGVESSTPRSCSSTDFRAAVLCLDLESHARPCDFSLLRVLLTLSVGCRPSFFLRQGALDSLFVLAAVCVSQLCVDHCR